ncbi:MAG TPA: hypothetical protein VMV92_31850 [Streptosporangiaceae bacterium]|nr:hypothetical protein [Streptosporangiaceae bacterium]
MNSDREYRAGQVPLPGFGDGAPNDWAPGDRGPGDRGPGGQPAPARQDGIRHARRMSNWTLAALIAGTGAATVALAHHAFPSATTTAGTSATAAVPGQATTVNGASGPQVAHSVASTSPSGVTTTTTTHIVNGKTVVTHVRHVPAYHDN